MNEMNSINIGFSIHRPEMIPITEKIMQEHDIICIEEPPDGHFTKMLKGTIKINSLFIKIKGEQAMSYDFCLGCGVLLNPQVYECPICGFDNSFEQYQDGMTNDDFLKDLSDDFNADDDAA